MFDSGDASYNISDPNPERGWKFQGYVGGFLATMIGPRHFITSDHIWRPDKFVSDVTFNGTSTVTYNVESSFNEGLFDAFGNLVPGRTVPGTDLRIYQIKETATAWAPLYTGSSEQGKEVRFFGTSATRGAEIRNPLGILTGWDNNGTGGGQARWASEVVSRVDSNYLYTNFSGSAGNAMLAPGDSGGGMFIKDGTTWKLAGLNYASLMGPWDNDLDHSTYFSSASIFNAKGLYRLNGLLWNLIGVASEAYSAHSRISTSATAIQTMMVVPVPEPSSHISLAVVALVIIHRRVRVLNSEVSAKSNGHSARQGVV